MFMTRLLRYLRGTVKIRVTGGFVERFINLCAHNGIPLWKAHRTGGVYTAVTLAGKYKAMRPLAKTAGVKLRLAGKYGLPFIRIRYRRRWGLLVGLVAIVVMLLFMSAFIWSIRIEPTQTVEEYVLRENLAQLGVRVGALRRDLDARDIERQMLLRVPELSWIALNITGSGVTVELTERTAPPDAVDVTIPHNVIATASGQIKAMEVYEGQALVKVGDAVAAGDILVSGLVESTGALGGPVTTVRMAHARARVVAEIAETVEIVVPLQTTELQPAPNAAVIRHQSLNLGLVVIPLSVGAPPKEPYKREQAETPLRLLGQSLPFSLRQTIYLPLREVSVTRTPEEALAKAQDDMIVEEKLRYSDCEILQRTADTFDTAESLTVFYHYIYQKDIASEVEIFTN